MATVARPEPRIEPKDVAPPAAAAAPKRRNFMLPLVAVLGAIGLIWGVRALNYSRSHETTDDAQVDGHVIPVLAKVGGYIDAIHMDENTHMAEGTPAVLIDTAEYQARVAQAAADLAAAQASVSAHGVTGAAFATVQTAVNQSAAADAEIVAAKANADKANADLARMQSLVDKQIISRQQLDAAQAAADGAQAVWLAAQRQSAAGIATVSNAQAGVRLADARMASAKAALDWAVLQLSYTKIDAPATGVVRNKSVEVGQLVQPGQALFALVTDTGAFVTANFKGDAARSHPRRPAGRVRCRRVWWSDSERRGRERCRHDRRAHGAPAAGQCDRQLHESGAARARAHPDHPGTGTGSSVTARYVGDRPRGDRATLAGEAHADL
jgi:membrane fusion protein (multidrug efflux system)